jgi:hypothetical protein
MRTCRRALGATAIVLALGLTGCGGDPEQAAEDTPTSESTTAAESESPADDAAAEGEQVDTSAFVQDMAAGVEASTTAQMSMSVDAAGQGMQADGQIDYTTDPPSMQMQMTMPGMSSGKEPLDLRMVDGVMYMNMGPMTQGKFFSFDLSHAKNLPPGMSGMTEQLDPLAAFSEFEDAISSVTFVGDEDVDGEQLAHYTVVVDASAVKSFQGLPAGADAPEEFTSDLWFDDQFRVRQMVTSVDAGGQPVAVEMQLSSWDEPVSIEAPPADQVVDPSRRSG